MSEEIEDIEEEDKINAIEQENQFKRSIQKESQFRLKDQPSSIDANLTKEIFQEPSGLMSLRKTDPFIKPFQVESDNFKEDNPEFGEEKRISKKK